MVGAGDAGTDLVDDETSRRRDHGGIQQIRIFAVDGGAEDVGDHRGGSGTFTSIINNSIGFHAGIEGNAVRQRAGQLHIDEMVIDIVLCLRDGAVATAGFGTEDVCPGAMFRIVGDQFDRARDDSAVGGDELDAAVGGAGGVHRREGGIRMEGGAFGSDDRDGNGGHIDGLAADGRAEEVVDGGQADRRVGVDGLALRGLLLEDGVRDARADDVTGSGTSEGSSARRVVRFGRFVEVGVDSEGVAVGHIFGGVDADEEVEAGVADALGAGQPGGDELRIRRQNRRIGVAVGREFRRFEQLDELVARVEGAVGIGVPPEGDTAVLVIGEVGQVRDGEAVHARDGDRHAEQLRLVDEQRIGTSLRRERAIRTADDDEVLGMFQIRAVAFDENEFAFGDVDFGGRAVAPAEGAGAVIAERVVALRNHVGDCHDFEAGDV